MTLPIRLFSLFPDFFDETIGSLTFYLHAAMRRDTKDRQSVLNGRHEEKGNQPRDKARHRPPEAFCENLDSEPE